MGLLPVWFPAEPSPRPAVKNRCRRDQWPLDTPPATRASYYVTTSFNLIILSIPYEITNKNYEMALIKVSTNF